MAGKQANMEDEFAGLDCNSSRLEKRFIRTMETLSKQPDKSIWYCGENWVKFSAEQRGSSFGIKTHPISDSRTRIEENAQL